MLLMSSALAGMFFTTSAPGKPQNDPQSCYSLCYRINKCGFLVRGPRHCLGPATRALCLGFQSCDMEAGCHRGKSEGPCRPEAWGPRAGPRLGRGGVGRHLK